MIQECKADSMSQETIVVIGNGMVGHRFIENMVELDKDKQYRIVTFCEEPRPAYDRVRLSKYFETRDPDSLRIANIKWYVENGIELYLGDRVKEIDPELKVVMSQQGVAIAYDHCVMATGSYPFVPPVPGIDKKGVFVYRTIEDLEAICGYSSNARSVAVVGGGLLGLEAAKAAYDLGLKTHVIEFADRLMPRQVDRGGSEQLVEQIEGLGLHVHLGHATKEVVGNTNVEGMLFSDPAHPALEVDMVIVSAGIRPRDELATNCGLRVGDRGGVVVNDQLKTSDENIYAIGEVALHNDVIYGLVAPGYEMASVLASNFCGDSKRFAGVEMSTKLKLLGVEVASFGKMDAEEDENVIPIVYSDPFSGVYKKLIFSADSKRLLGGVLVGDASDYGILCSLQQDGNDLEISPADLVYGRQGNLHEGMNLPDNIQVCSCNNVSKDEIISAIQDGACTPAEVQSCTRAGAGCGGCVPVVADLVSTELSKTGTIVDKSICEHFRFSRTELYEIIKIKQIKTFAELLENHGNGRGCEICKPTVASIFASLWNENVLDHDTLQDTNDRFLANIQRGGLFSVIPRVPGGEITPRKLIVLGEVAEEYGLYTKITGGQRVDLFGAQVHELPEIWEKLIQAGFESGHAYGKALRTVKSCVGSAWCRYGVQDSVGFAIRIEERYRGIRAPHKIKSAVSGCTRECAEAQSKDFGLIATEEGYNLYVGGNGGAKPRHAELLATNLNEETAIKYIDRFLMYYIQTADKLNRTATWLEKLEGGIQYLRSVVIDDKLGICSDLEEQMQYLVDTYKCEWTEVVNDPTRREWFKQFINSDETELGIEIIDERGQRRPADWKKDSEMLPLVEEITIDQKTFGQWEEELDNDEAEYTWFTVGKKWEFPEDGGRAIKYGAVQIAVFHFCSPERWYASQNMCPHKRAFVLSNGLIGSAGDVDKVACPLHKKTFNLDNGDCTSGDGYSIRVFDVRVHGDDIQLFLPDAKELEPLLATGPLCATACSN